MNNAQRMRKWRASLSPAKQAIIRTQNKAHAKKRYQENPIWARNRLMKQFHKITWGEFLIRVDSQNGRCAICGVMLEVESKKCVANKACMDHNHGTGENRGVLCHLCNRALGMFHESIEVLMAAIAYIERWKQPRKST